MGKNSAISWTDHTFNPWWGCTEVGGSGACDNCYARVFAERIGYGPTGQLVPIWGDDKPRRFFGAAHWAQPQAWDAAARKAGQVDLVFCMSMGDWAEGRPDQVEHLKRLWEIQEATPNLIWLMLTKRPQLIKRLAPARQINATRWFGITAEDQHWFDIRWKHLRAIHSDVYWLSVEPLLGRLKLPKNFLALGPRAWVIVGGESGAHARPMNIEWVRELRDQCLEARVPFHFKQWGQWEPGGGCAPGARATESTLKGKFAMLPQVETWDGLTYPHVTYTDSYPRAFQRFGQVVMKRVRLVDENPYLDGESWRQFPAAAGDRFARKVVA